MKRLTFILLALIMVVMITTQENNPRGFATKNVSGPAPAKSGNISIILI